MALTTAEKWGHADTREELMRFCGWPEPAVRAVTKGCAFCSTGMLDQTPSGSGPYTAQPFCGAFWVNLPLCAGMLCVPCCSGATTVRTLQKIEHINGGSGTCLEHWVAVVATNLFCVTPCYYASMRGDLRKKYNLEGSPCMDFWCTCCFAPCITCQDANEIQQKDGNFYIPFAGLSHGGSKVAAAK